MTLDANTFNGAQVTARASLTAHDHHDQPLSGQALAASTELRCASIEATRVGLASEDVLSALAGRVSLAGDQIPHDLTLTGQLITHQPVVIGEVTAPAPAPRSATYRAADGRAVIRFEYASNGTLAYPQGDNLWRDLTSVKVDLAEPTVAFVYVQGAFQYWYDPNDSRTTTTFNVVVAPFVRLSTAEPLSLAEMAKLTDPRDRAAWLAAESASSRKTQDDSYTRLNGNSQPGYIRNGGVNGSNADGRAPTPFSLLMALPLPPGQSEVVLRAWCAPQHVAWATLTVHLVPP